MHDRAVPVLADPGDVVPGGRLLVDLLDALEEAHRRAVGAQAHRHLRLERPAAQVVGQPARLGQRLRREAQRLAQVDRRRDARALVVEPVARARDRRRVDGEHETRDAGALDALDDRRGRLAAADVVELVEDRAARGVHDLLDRRAGHAAHELDRPRVAGRAGDAGLAVAVAHARGSRPTRRSPASRARGRGPWCAGRAAGVKTAARGRNITSRKACSFSSMVALRAAAGLEHLEDALRERGVRRACGRPRRIRSSRRS